MSDLTHYLAVPFLTSIRNAGLVAGTLYLGAFTTAPTAAYTSAVPTGVQVSGGGYAKAAVNFTAVSIISNVATMTNTNVITFPAATADWGTIVAFGLFDRNSGTQALLKIELIAEADRPTILSGQTYTIAIGALVSTMA